MCVAVDVVVDQIYLTTVKDAHFSFRNLSKEIHEENTKRGYGQKAGTKYSGRGKNY